MFGIINYQNLKIGDVIKVVEPVYNHFDDNVDSESFETKIEDIYFAPKGEFGYLKIFAKNEKGICRPVKWIYQNGKICGTDIRISIVELKQQNSMICLNDRKSEFISALQRAASDLEVFPDFERDQFVVVNKAEKSEYRIELKTVNGRVYGRCECKDFENRKRICKHLGTVLADTILGVCQPPKFTVLFADTVVAEDLTKQEADERIEAMVGFEGYRRSDLQIRSEIS